RIWDAESGAERRVLTGHEGEVYTLTFHPKTGVLASCASDATVRLWDTDGRLLHKLAGHAGTVYTVAFGGGDLFTCGADKTARAWDPTSGKALRTLPPHRNEVFAVASTPDGTRQATAGKDRMIHVIAAPSATAGARE